jgi:AAA domain
MGNGHIEQSAAVNKSGSSKEKILGRFEAGWNGGFGRELLPSPGPDAVMSPTSGIKEPGKVPGLRKPDGTHIGFPEWTKHISTREEMKLWDSWDGMNVSLQARFLPGLDIDTDDLALADKFEEAAIKRFGNTSVRGRTGSPRRLLMLRGKGFHKRRFAFAKDGKTHAVELLAEGQQYIIDGRHPKGGFYKWRNKHPYERGPMGVPEITEEQVDAFFTELPALVEKHGYKVVTRAKLRSTPIGPRRSLEELDKLEHPDHASDPQMVLDTLPYLPNEYDYDDFIRMLAAIKHALGPSREEFYAIEGGIEDWILSYGGDNTSDWARERWDSINDASLGWNWLEGEARAKGYDGQTQLDFADDPPAEYMPAPDLLDEYGPAIKPEAAAATLTLPIAPTTYQDLKRPIPMREFLYDRHYIRRFLSTTIAQGGVGKSKLVIAEALAMVSGKPLLGVPVPKPLRVLYWNLEDPEDELRRQFAAGMMFHGLTSQDIGDRLHFYSGREFRGLKIATEERGAIKINKPAIAALRKQIIETGADVGTFDPFVALHRVTENDNNKIDAVCKELSDLAEECNCAIEAVHHSRKFSNSQSEASVDDGRGASAMLAAVRSARVRSPFTCRAIAPAASGHHPLGRSRSPLPNQRRTHKTHQRPFLSQGGRCVLLATLFLRPLPRRHYAKFTRVMRRVTLRKSNTRVSKIPKPINRRPQ